MKQIRVLIADDHSLIRIGLTTLLSDHPEMLIVGQAENGQQVVEIACTVHPDIILMDVKMPLLTGIEATRIIHQEKPQIKIIILTVSENDQDLCEAIRAGASGYLLKNLSSDRLYQTILNVHFGEVAIPEKMMSSMFHSFLPTEPQQSAYDRLTSREIEILRMVVDGASNKSISEALCISEHTVKIHLSTILEKLHVENRVQAAVFAVRQGLTDCPTRLLIQR